MTHQDNECPYFLGEKTTEEHKECARNCADIAEKYYKYKAIVDEIKDYCDLVEISETRTKQRTVRSITKRINEILEKHGVK